MCTLSWIPRNDGYSVYFSRDEQRTRAAGLPPAAWRQGGRRVLAPRDPAGGGSWTAVNDAGLTLAMLNRHPAHGTSAPGRRSRGLLVTSLADACSPSELEARLRAEPVVEHAPFALVALAPGEPALICEWDGAALAGRRHAGDGLVLTSSSLDQARAEATRDAACAALRRELGRVNEAFLDALHRGHHGPRELAVCMHRADAATVSLTRITVDDDSVAMAYEAGPPCGRAEPTRWRMPRATWRAGLAP